MRAPIRSARISSLRRIITLAAMQLHSGNGSDGGETLVGVVTAKLVCEVEAEDVDVGRWLLRDGHSGGGVRWFCGANSSIPPASLADMSTSVPPWTPYAYILTLGRGCALVLGTNDSEDESVVSVLGAVIPPEVVAGRSNL